jgi:ADP-heptose:LPS heptosyltransferase
MEFESDLDEILRAMDQPSTDGVNTYLVSKAAARSGMKVALSGLGGDELLAGYPSFRDVPRIRRLCAAVPVSGAAGVLLRRAVAPLLSRFTSPKYASLLEYGSSDGGAYLLRRGLFMPWELPQVLDAQFAAQGLERLQSLARLGECCAGLAGGRPVVSTLELSWYMRNQLLRDSDWAGMAHSLEIRLPYLDLEFFRAALGAAAAGQPLGKADLAGQLDPPLPAEILLRRKTGFLAPVREWCTDPAREGNTDRGLRGWARIVLGESLGASGVAATSSGARPVHFGSAWRRKADREAMVQAAEFKSRQPRGRRLLRRTQASLAKAAFAATNATLRAAARSLWPRPRPSDAEQVCIFRIGNIGDIVCALPAIASVRRAYPRARLTLLTSPGRKGLPGAAEVLAGSDSVDDLWVYHAEDIDTFGKRRMLLRGLRARRFDVWIDLPNNRTTVSRQLRDMAVAWMVRARWARGWCIDSLDWAAQAQSEYLPFSNEVERTMDIVRRSGFDAGAVSFGLGVAPGARERVEALFREHGIAPGHLVAIAPGAKRSTNLWDIGRFAEVGRELSALGHTVLVLGGESEAGACRRLAEQIGPAARTFAGELSVVESCAVLRCCSLLVCLDSGVQHMAAAVGTPCVSLFSFWQMPGKWHPFGDRNIVIRKWVSCHTCMLDECPNGNLCMNEIGVGEVMRHATEILGSGAPRPVAAA